MRLGFNHPHQPFSSREVCSLCQGPYNPDVARQFPESSTMHFCPRDTCRTAWHRECLSTNPMRTRPTCTDRKLSLMCSIPSDLLGTSASSNASPASPPSLLSLLSKSKRTPPQSQSNTGKRKQASEVDALSLFEDLPQGLVETASQPIVKPTLELSGIYEQEPKRWKGKAPQVPENVIYDVAGNIAIVLKARVLVNNLLRGTTILPGDWRKEIGWNGNKTPSTIVDGVENGPCPPLLCPTCGEHI